MLNEANIKNNRSYFTLVASMIIRKHITRSALAVFCCLLCFAATAQIKITNVSSKNPDSDHLYIGVSNRIVISGIAGNVTLKSQYGEISSLKAPGEFSYGSLKLSDKETLIVISKGKIVATRKFRMIALPGEKAQLGGITDSFARPADIIAQRKLLVIMPGSDYNLVARIESFSMTLYSSVIEGGKKTLITAGSDIPEQAFPFIKKLQKGDRIFFEKIIRSCPVTKPRMLLPFTLWIR